MGFTHPGCVKKGRIDGCFSIVTYNKIAKKLIYSFKYKPYVSKLAEFLGELFYEGAVQKEGLMNILKKPSVFVPIPLHNSKERQRGYNHAEILANELAKKLGIEVCNLLERTRNTKSQFGLSKEERRENIKDAFEINSKLITHNLELKDTNIFLVDDILTTGSTLVEAGEILKKTGAKAVFGLTFARD